MLKAKIWTVLTAILLAASVHAATLVVYPFGGDDPAAGSALAQAVAEAFAPDHEVYGPALAPTVAPPFHSEGGFYNPVILSGTRASGLSATMLLRAASGADLVLNGRLEELEGHLLLQLSAALPDRQLQLNLQSPADDPGALAAQVTRLAARLLGLPGVPETRAPDLDGSDRLLGEAIHYAGTTGGLSRALALLGEQDLAGDPYALSLKEALESVLEGSSGGDAAQLALLSLNTERLDEAWSAGLFRAAAAENSLPALGLWEAMLRLSSSGADADLQLAAAGWPYGRAVELVHAGADAEAVRRELPTADSAALSAYALLARFRGDTELEKEVLQRLGHVDPWQASTFERLSFIAFDEDEPLAALEALAVAVTLDPGSDLYWTNLGWAQYLSGLPERSEESSQKAVLLAPGQTVAHYNLGLVRAVDGRLTEALAAYAEALRHDPSVNDDALEDLRDALVRYPGQPAVHYALGWLLEAAGRREEARQSYLDYLEQRGSGEYADRARARIAMLELPPPALQLEGGLRVFLGRLEAEPSEVQAGDPLTPVFEIVTPGEVLPTRLGLELTLTQDGKAGAALREDTVLTLPVDTVGFVMDGLVFRLPHDLPAGDYVLTATVTATEGREASERLRLHVGAAEDPLRGLFGYGITLQGIGGGAPLFDRRSLGHWPESRAVLLRELEETRDAADEVLPRIEAGRFRGMSGGEAFAAAGDADLRDFLTWMADPELQGASFVFVDTFAQWIIDGAPVN